MNIGIIGGFKLMGQEPPVRVSKLFGFLIHPKAFCRPRRQNHFGPQEAHQLATFNRKAVGHCDHQRIAFCGTDHGQANACITAGRLDNSLSWL